MRAWANTPEALESLREDGSRLVVDRRTNAEIAAVLFLSHKTVETHMRISSTSSERLRGSSSLVRWNAPIAAKWRHRFKSNWAGGRSDTRARQ